jgi:hypothetical protein
VGVHRDGRLAEGGVQHHVGGLAAHPGQRLQRGAIGAVPRRRGVLQQQTAQFDDVLRLAAIQADGADVVAQAFLAEREDLRRGAGAREQAPGGLVDADIGGLRRKHHGDQQLERRGVLQLRLRLRVQLAQAAEDFAADLLVHPDRLRQP